MYRVFTLKSNYEIKSLDDLLVFINFLSAAHIEFEVQRV